MVYFLLVQLFIVTFFALIFYVLTDYIFICMFTNRRDKKAITPRIVRPGGLIAIKEYDITAQQVQPTTSMLCLHLHEALFRMGDQYTCHLFRTLSLPNWLREVGLVELRQKPTLIVRSQPLRPVEKNFVGALLEFYAGQVERAALPAEESDLWRKLTDLNAGDHIFHHPDFQYRCIQTVFVGRVQ